MSDLSAIIIINKTKEAVMQDNNIEDDSSEVYVYLKRPFLFNIRYNSREIWNKMTEEDKAPYINYEEFYEEYRLIRLRSIGYPILAVVYLFAMSAMVLYIIYMLVTGRSNKMLFPPLVIMLCVTFTALVQRLMAMVKAISNAAAVTIPAGETTWGAVFIANGLQLILAVLLIVLGLNIVFHSFSAYKKAEHNSEAKA